MPARTGDRHRRLRDAASVRTVADFKYQVRTFDRPRIVAEGDSWFEYPRSWRQKPGNIVDHVQKWTRGKVNLLRLGSNGDEATAMLSAPQRHKLTKLLDQTSRSGRPVDLLLFSGGGNDVVGDWDLPRFVLPYRPDVAVEELFGKALEDKLVQIELAYRELLSIRDAYSPTTRVLTHTYDRARPTGVGVKVLGRKVAGPWLKPALDDAGFPAGAEQQKAVTYLLGRLRDQLQALEAEQEDPESFVVVDTQGIVRKKEWVNEIHPGSKGFRRVAKKVYDRMRGLVPALPKRPS